jgi:hypothetical protein
MSTYLIAPAVLSDAELALFVPHRPECAVMATPGVDCDCGALAAEAERIPQAS